MIWILGKSILQRSANVLLRDLQNPLLNIHIGVRAISKMDVKGGSKACVHWNWFISALFLFQYSALVQYQLCAGI